MAEETEKAPEPVRRPGTRTLLDKAGNDVTPKGPPDPREARAQALRATIKAYKADDYTPDDAIAPLRAELDALEQSLAKEKPAAAGAAATTGGTDVENAQ